MTTESELRSTNYYGPFAGFRNMLQKENARWWNRKSLITQFIVWFVLLNALGICTMVGMAHIHIPPAQTANPTTLDPNAQAAMENGISFPPDIIATTGMQIFFYMAGLLVYIGAVILGHDAILKERESCTAAWLLSKPVSRKAFMFSKLLTISAGALAIILLLQGLIAYAACSVAQGNPMPALPFLAGLGILGIGVLFYLIMSIALGTLIQSRAVALGLPIILGLGSGVIQMVISMIDLVNKNNLLDYIGYITPWKFTDYATALATGGTFLVNTPLSQLPYWPWSVIATLIWILLFIAAAVLRFEQLEL
ncbi:MAG TPA: ABC transporter permease subunit [Methanocella sp.]|nr:ABC transporter permease subunit [Methanocella sp.]